MVEQQWRIQRKIKEEERLLWREGEDNIYEAMVNVEFLTLDQEKKSKIIIIDTGNSSYLAIQIILI